MANANKQRSIVGQDWRRDRDPKSASRAVKEYLATLDDTAWGAASDVVPKFVSPSDPAAQWTGAHKGPAFFAYSDNYLIDVKFGVIVDVEASRAIRQAEVGAAKAMIERTEERFGLKPERLAADTAYGAAPMLNWLVEEKDIAQGRELQGLGHTVRLMRPSYVKAYLKRGKNDANDAAAICEAVTAFDAAFPDQNE